MKKNKFRLILLTGIVVVVAITAAVYGFMALSEGNANPVNFFPLGVVLLIIIFMGFFIVKRYKDIKKDVPLEDEKSRKVMTLAAAKSFYVSLYWLLAISWLEPFLARLIKQEYLTSSQSMGGGIAGMALLFFGFWFYYNKKGKIA